MTCLGFGLGAQQVRLSRMTRFGFGPGAQQVRLSRLKYDVEGQRRSQMTVGNSR